MKVITRQDNKLVHGHGHRLKMTRYKSKALNNTPLYIEYRLQCGIFQQNCNDYEQKR